jgi:hypothetical protein
MGSFEQKRGLRPIIGLAFLFGAFVPPVPTPIGIGPGFQLDAASPAVRQGAPVGRFRCMTDRRPPTHAHVELFARQRVLLLPQGVGVSRRCTYAVRTTSPTGVAAFDRLARPTVGDLFAIWGQPLSSTRLAGFRGAVHAFVGGRPWRRNPRTIPLSPHGQITLEIGGFVRPHAFFLFPAGG